MPPPWHRHPRSSATTAARNGVSDPPISFDVTYKPWGLVWFGVDVPYRCAYMHIQPVRLYIIISLGRAILLMIINIYVVLEHARTHNFWFLYSPNIYRQNFIMCRGREIFASILFLYRRFRSLSDKFNMYSVLG